MENDFNQLPENIKDHLKSITKTSGLPDNEESLLKIFDNWFEKKVMFEDQIRALDMIEADAFAKDEKKAALMLTYSGSLISLGTLRNETRWVEYSSIKLRSDVPDIIIDEKAAIGTDTGVDRILDFREGRIKSTSSLFKIAVCGDDVSLDEQDKRIREATIFLTNGFMKINRTLSVQADADMGFTMKSIVGYVAKRNNIPISQAKRIIDDYISVIESGMLLGDRVPLGRIGRLSLKLRAAQKARVGRNPSTGEEITVKAKPETLVPKISFSRYIKERAALAKVEAEPDDESDD